MDILEQIIAAKQKEVAQKKIDKPIERLTQRPYFKEACFSMKKALRKENSSGIIAEHKRKSPSLGWIKEDANVLDITKGYAEAGAAALSILTDETFFGGTNFDLLNSRKAVHIPILRKDFVIDEYQLFEAKSIGADVVLLIAECLSVKQVKDLSAMAHNLGLEVLLELHSAAQLDKICDTIDCVGVNNRNLKTFEVNIETSVILSALLPSSVVKVAESGISSPETMAYLRNYDFQGFLIGEAFMKTENPAQALKNFLQ
jgi:indole-3-glycerol phosphate synthase